MHIPSILAHGQNSVHLVKQLEPHNTPDPVLWFGYYAEVMVVIPEGVIGNP